MLKDNRKVVVSLTSWAKRIDQVHETIKTILGGIMVPDYIVLNLSLEEFPNREKDLPESLTSLAKEHKELILNFVEGNTRTFKKLIPTIQLLYGKPDKYYVITIDDDNLYSNKFVDTMVRTMESLPPECGSFCPSIVNIQGGFTIYKSEIFKPDLWEKLTDEVISYGIDDEYYDHYLSSHNVPMYHFNGGIPVNYSALHIEWKETCPLHDEYLKDNRIAKSKEAIHKIIF